MGPIFSLNIYFVLEKVIEFLKVCRGFTEFNSFLEPFEKIANILVGIFTVFLGFYVFIYQKSKDARDIDTLWFKDLVIEPNLDKINDFYSEITNACISSGVNQRTLTQQETIDLIQTFKISAADYRVKFLVLLQKLIPTVHDEMLRNADNLIDDLTVALTNNTIDFTDTDQYRKEITARITNSYGAALKLIVQHTKRGPIF